MQDLIKEAQQGNKIMQNRIKKNLSIGDINYTATNYNTTTTKNTQNN